MPRLLGSEHTASPTIGVIVSSIVLVSLACTKPPGEPTASATGEALRDGGSRGADSLPGYPTWPPPQPPTDLAHLVREAFPDPCEGLFPSLTAWQVVRSPLLYLQEERIPWLQLKDPKSRCERRAFCASYRRQIEAPRSREGGQASTRAPVPGWSYFSDWLEWRDREIGSGFPDLISQKVFDCAREKSDPEIWNGFLLQQKSRDRLGWPHFRMAGSLEGYPSAWPFARVTAWRDADLRGFDLSYVVLQLGLASGDHGPTVDQTTDLTGTILVVPVRPGRPSRIYTSSAFFPRLIIVGRDPGQPERVFPVNQDLRRLWEQQNGRDLHVVRSRIR